VPTPFRWTAQSGVFLICTTPRSGSWLLSDGLASTSRAGNPREWFNAIEEAHYGSGWRMEHSAPLDYRTYLWLANAASTTSNGVSGVKLHYYQFAELPKKMADIEGFRGLGPAETLRRLFPNARHIWLTRRDQVRQAISFGSIQSQ
jgi:LPS sulfotransferase NodH